MTAMARLASFLFVLWVGVTVSTGAELQKRIVGGQDCKDTEGLYHVKLLNINRNLVCGGSLISDQWVLTAAHCWENGMYAVVGVHPGSKKDEQVIAAHEIFEDKDAKGNVRKHDLMLLKLPGTVTDIKPVELPDCQKKLKQGDKVQITGYASTTPGPNNKKQIGESQNLQCAEVEVVDCQEFRNDMQTTSLDIYNEYAYQHWLCRNSPTVDTCQGDSGGGVIYKVNGKDMIYGVHAFSNTVVCATPGAFMDICEKSYNDWIKSFINPPKNV